MSAAGGGFPPPPGGFGAPPGFVPPQPGFQPAGFPAGGSPYPQAAPEPAFVLSIPADPTWQPIEGGDTLEKDGFYAGKIISEKVKNDDGKLQVIMTVELLDEDAVGKKLSKFMPNSTSTTKDTWFLWRGLMRSIYGTVQQAQQALNYTPGVFTGATVYFKTEAYADTRGTMRTGIGSWSTRDEWEEARKTGRNRWPAKISAAQNPGVGALPGGTGGLPGMPGGGLPGAPSMGGLPGAPGGLPGMPNVPTGVPMPGAAPMQPAAPAQQLAPPPAMGPLPGAPAFGTAPPPAQGGFGFPPPPAAAPHQAPVGFPAPPAANGIPQPTAAGIAGAFPGTLPR